MNRRKRKNKDAAGGDGENVKYMQIKVFSVFNLLYAVS